MLKQMKADQERRKALIAAYRRRLAGKSAGDPERYRAEPEEPSLTTQTDKRRR